MTSRSVRNTGKKIANWILSRKDRHIGANLRKFRAGIDETSIQSAARPRDFEADIEVLIPCYNHAPYLADAFESLVNQSLQVPLAVTFINDNSKDASLEEMENISLRAPSHITVKILDNPRNLLQGGSLNRAIVQSQRKLFVVLNADDLLTPDCLEKTVETYRADPRIFMLGGLSVWFSGPEPPPEFHQKRLEDLHLTVLGPEDALRFESLNDLNISHSSSSFFRVAWEVVGGYFPRSKRVCSFDDRDFQMRVCSCFPVGILDYPMEFYRTNSSRGRALF